MGWRFRDASSSAFVIDGFDAPIAVVSNPFPGRWTWAVLPTFCEFSAFDTGYREGFGFAQTENAAKAAAEEFMRRLVDELSVALYVNEGE